MMQLDAVKQKFSLEFKYIESITKMVCVYPFKDASKISILIFKVLIFLIGATGIQLLYGFFMSRNNGLIDLTDKAPSIGTCVMTINKYIRIRLYATTYENTFLHFRTSLWEMYGTKPREDAKIAKKYILVARFVCRFLIYYSFPLAILLNCIPLICMFYDKHSENNASRLLYPYDGWYPFDKVKWYLFVYLWECTIQSLVIIIYSVTDVLGIFIYIGLCLELRLLQNSFEKLVSDDIEEKSKNNSKNVHDDIAKKLKILISRYQKIEKLTVELDDALGAVMFVYYASGSISLCLTAFTFTMVEDVYKKLRFFFFFMSLVIAILDQCVIGQIITDHSTDLRTSIYSCYWYFADRRVKNMIKMMLLRTQKPLTLTAKGYVAMNLNTFCRICSNSWSFFNLLRTIYKS